MNNKKLDETDYTTTLASDIHSYVKHVSNENHSNAYTPHSTHQSFKNLDKSSCFDLLYKITNSSLLILEVKVTHDQKKLHSFSVRQRLVDEALCGVGIPLDYCYNLVNEYSATDVFTLENSMVATPQNVADDKGNITNSKLHITLKNKIDDLIDSATGNAKNFGALFSKNFLQTLRQANTKLLFFCFNSGDLSVFTIDQIEDLYRSYESEINLVEDIDVNNASYEELIEDFSSKALELQEILHKQKELEDKNKNDNSPDFNL